MRPLKPGQLVTERIEELEAEVERLQRLIYNNMPHILDEQTRHALGKLEMQLTDTAAFLDGMACDFDVRRVYSGDWFDKRATDCRAEAKRLRGETVEK